MVNVVSINDMGNSILAAWRRYKKSDPIMLRGSVTVKNSIYRKNSSKNELWHGDMAFNYDLFLLIIAAAAGAAILVMALRRAFRRGK